ncbi:MAG: hypothetical protein ACI9SJ_000755 [Flavobacteriaceae bacterium]|jgi:hypothetical protein|uniref:hypothetical protein n=1 Tax=Candidatus Marifrigoribacter sp. Uisw_064 TaxID=3230970 RepID=UPI003AE382C0
MKILLFISALLLLPLIGFSQPANDECVDRELITIGVLDYLECSIDNTTATESMDASCDGVVDNNLDVWYEFVMPVDGNLYVTNLSGTHGISVFDACGGTEIVCFNGDGFVYGLSSGMTSVMRVSERDIFAGTINFRVQAFEEAGNDECAGGDI